MPESGHPHHLRALKLTPKADVEEVRKLEAERIAGLRQRIWSELAGRPDSKDTTKTIRPDAEVLVALVGQAIRLCRRLLKISPEAKHERVR